MEGAIRPTTQLTLWLSCCGTVLLVGSPTAIWLFFVPWFFPEPPSTTIILHVNTAWEVYEIVICWDFWGFFLAFFCVFFENTQRGNFKASRQSWKKKSLFNVNTWSNHFHLAHTMLICTPLWSLQLICLIVYSDSSRNRETCFNKFLQDKIDTFKQYVTNKISTIAPVWHIRITHNQCSCFCVHRVAAECQECVEGTVVNVHRLLAPACLYQWNTPESNPDTQVWHALWISISIFQL